MKSISRVNQVSKSKQYDEAQNQSSEMKKDQYQIDTQNYGEDSMQKRRKKSFSPVKNLKLFQKNLKPPNQTQQTISRPPVLISSFSPSQPDPNQPSTKNPVTYLLQYQSQNPSSLNKRSEEQIQLIKKLIEGNKIFSDLGFDSKIGSSTAKTNDGMSNHQQILKQICHSIVLLWSQIPNITETKPNQLYLILQGKTFQYIHNQSAAIKLKIHENNDYIMIRKLIENDYFVTINPIRSKAKYTQKTSEQFLHLYRKYQLMVDEKTLMGKISDQIFVKFFQKALFQKTKQLVSFMKKITLFENLPDVVFHELSKFVKSIKFPRNVEIISIQQKSKDIYFIKKGQVQFKLIATKSTNNEKKQEAKTQILSDHDVFGMDTFHTVKSAEITIEYTAKSLTQCQLYCIDKRILAIVISSFEKEFQAQQKFIKAININSQIKGQNYLSQQQDYLSKNAQRIKTSQKKIRDVKLLSYSRKSKRQVNTYIPEKDRISQRKNEIKSNQAKLRSSAGFNLLRNKSIRSQTSLVHLKESTDSMFWTLKNKYQAKYPSSKEKDQQLGNYNNYVMPVMEEQNQISSSTKNLTLLSNSSFNEFDRLRKKSLQVFSSSPRSKGKSPNVCSNQKIKESIGETAKLFIPKIQSKSSFFQNFSNSGKIESEIIKNHIQKKIKQDLIRKSQQVLQRKTNTHRNSIKNIKKFYNVNSFSPKKVEQMVSASKKSRKQLTDELFDRMNNIKQHPLLCLIQSQRKKMESLSKVKSKELKQVQQKKIDKRIQRKSNYKKIVILSSQIATQGIMSQQDVNN